MVGDGADVDDTLADAPLPPRIIELHVHFHWPETPLQVQFVPFPKSAVALTMQVSKEPKMTIAFTVDTTDGTANFQFADDHGNPTDGPTDSITGAPIVPAAVSDTPSVLTSATAVAGTTPGSWTAALTPVAEGTANLSPAPLENSDGSPVLAASGAPFGEAPPVEITVGAGPAAELEMSVTG